MAHHVITEFNLDLSRIFRDDPRFHENLYLALAHAYQNNERVLKNYGIKVLNEHHSSDCTKVLATRKAAPKLLEACKLVYANLGAITSSEKIFDHIGQELRKAIAEAESK